MMANYWCSTDLISSNRKTGVWNCSDSKIWPCSPALRVRDTLSDRKYQGSYQAVVELLKQHQLPREDPRRFFEQVAVSVMVHHGDSHLKNFGLLYRSATDAWLAPM